MIGVNAEKSWILRVKAVNTFGDSEGAIEITVPERAGESAVGNLHEEKECGGLARLARLVGLRCGLSSPAS